MQVKRETTTMTITIVGTYVVVANSTGSQGHNNSELVHRSKETANTTDAPVNNTRAHETWDVACNIVEGKNQGGVATSRWW